MKKKSTRYAACNYINIRVPCFFYIPGVSKEKDICRCEIIKRAHITLHETVFISERQGLEKHSLREIDYRVVYCTRDHSTGTREKDREISGPELKYSPCLLVADASSTIAGRDRHYGRLFSNGERGG